MASTDARTFLHACLERALWHQESGGNWAWKLLCDLGQFTGERADLIELGLTQWGPLFGEATDAADARRRVQAAADLLGLPRLRTLDDLAQAAAAR